jgi:hypothetical protein
MVMMGSSCCSSSIPATRCTQRQLIYCSREIKQSHDYMNSLLLYMNALFYRKFIQFSTSIYINKKTLLE